MDSFTHAPEIIKPPRVAAGLAIAGLAANAALLLVLAGLALWTITALDPGGLTAQTRELRDGLVLGTVGQVALTLLTAVAVIVWLWRARTNADVIDLPDGWGRPWVIFGWIVPILNFRVPRAIVGTVWRTSAPGTSLGLVNAWWATWVIYLIGARVANLDLTGTSAQIKDRLELYLPVALDGAAAAVLGALVVWRLTRAQEAQAARLAAAAAQPPPAVPDPAVSDPA
ncbi:DUF4328 domain-containing protein [Actinomadura verrucosospora]|uniref:Aromatic ring-opening dioxygenase n=1 Tax=Actinomadura verrucosospora TaxID=46165 RepID=A0A7D4A4B2_ACTVE|nr:DUF4328 domain-containing protein [Actinomadura verrucosospora]QKG24884.1 aromatic ring-opening dioxygenase [Actinomadura verrucosospora]